MLKVSKTLRACAVLMLLVTAGLFAEGKEGISYVTDVAGFDKAVASGTVLVDFYADWCGPCRQLAPNLEKLAESKKGVKIVKVNVDKAKELSEKYKVRSIPMLMLFKDGKEAGKTVGYKSLEELAGFVTGKEAAPKKACCPNH